MEGARVWAPSRSPSRTADGAVTRLRALAAHPLDKSEPCANRDDAIACPRERASERTRDLAERSPCADVIEDELLFSGELVVFHSELRSHAGKAQAVHGVAASLALGDLPHKLTRLERSQTLGDAVDAEVEGSGDLAHRDISTTRAQYFEDVFLPLLERRGGLSWSRTLLELWNFIRKVSSGKHGSFLFTKIFKYSCTFITVFEGIFMKG